MNAAARILAFGSKSAPRLWLVPPNGRMANAPAGGNLRGEKDAGNVMAEHTPEPTPTDEQFANSIARLASQVQSRIRQENDATRYALAFSLLRASAVALHGRYDDDRVNVILDAIADGGRVDGVESVSVYPIDRQIEAGRLGEYVRRALTMVPYDRQFPMDGEQHRKIVADCVIKAIVERLEVSCFWKKFLPEDWNSSEKHAAALSAIEEKLSKSLHTEWTAKNSPVPGKLIRAYLRTVRTMGGISFKDDWFDDDPGRNSSDT